MGRAKVKGHCRCDESRPRTVGLVPEPMCTTCARPIRRRPQAGGGQARSPVATWAGPGSCPPAPELSTTAGRRGAELARQERHVAIGELEAVLDDPAAGLKVAQRVAFTVGLERLRAAAEADPPTAAAPPRASRAARPPQAPAAPIPPPPPAFTADDVRLARSGRR